MSSFTAILREFAESTTAHGLGRVSTSKTIWLRIFWLLAFLASLGVFIWQTSNLVKYYYSRPIAVDTKTVYGSVDFPAVTFCNLNPLRSSKLSLGGKTLEEALQELSNNIHSELTGSPTGEPARRRRDVTENHSSGASSSQVKAQYDTDMEDQDLGDQPSYGFGSSRKAGAKRRVRRGGSSAPPTYCEVQPCQNGGTCMEGDSIYSCNCPEGYSGFLCETGVNETGVTNSVIGSSSIEATTLAAPTYCEVQPCQNGGTCVEGDSIYSCTCAEGYSGFLCETGVNETGMTNSVIGSSSIEATTLAGSSSSSSPDSPPVSDVTPHTELPPTDGRYNWTIDGFWTTNWTSHLIVNSTFAATTINMTNTTYPHEPSVPFSSSSEALPSDISRPSASGSFGSDDSISSNSYGSSSASSEGSVDIVQEDPADEYYIPEVDISDKPWFANTTGSVTAEVKNTRKLSEALSDTPLEKRRAMGYQIDGMLQECTWNGRICTPMNFSSFYSKKYGNCFSFNSGHDRAVRKLEKSGALFGLTMTLFIDQSDYIDTFASGVGIRMLIHRQEEQPFPEDQGFTLIPGLKTSISVSMRHYERLAEPYSNCTYGTTNETFMFSKNYSTLACQKSCSQSRKLSRCQCADPLLSVSDEAEICTDSAAACLEEIDADIGRGEIQCNCPELCDENVFVTSVSTSTWPGEKFLSKVQKLFSGRDGLKDALDNASSISENFVKVEVYFDEIQRIEITESQGYDAVQLLADIGGQLGLWIGVSVLTGAEVVQLLIEMIVFFVRRKKVSEKTIHPTGSTKLYSPQLPKVDC